MDAPPSRPAPPACATADAAQLDLGPPLLTLTTSATPHPADDGACARTWLAPGDMLTARLGAGRDVCVRVNGEATTRLGPGAAIAAAWPTLAAPRGVATLSAALAYALGIESGAGGVTVTLHAAPPVEAPGDAPALRLRPMVRGSGGETSGSTAAALLLAPLFGGEDGSTAATSSALAAVAALAARRAAGRRLAPGTRLPLPLLGRTLGLEVVGADPALRAVGPGTDVSIVLEGSEGRPAGAAPAAAGEAGAADSSDEEEQEATGGDAFPGSTLSSPSAAAAAAVAAAAAAADAAVGGGPSGPAARAAARAATAGATAAASGAAGAGGFAGLGGVDAAAARLRDLATLPLTRPALFAAYGLAPPVGILLYGPPGTGKTALARAAAADAGAALLVVNGPDLASGRVGGGEAGVRGVFAAARAAAPCILFFDEVDAAAPAGGGQAGRFGGGDGGGGGGGTGAGGAPAAAATAAAGAAGRLAAALAAELDALASSPTPPRVIVLAATNRVDGVDPALRRPGRLDAEVEVGPPTPGGRAAILKTCLAPLAHALTGADIASVAEAAHGFVGADLALLVREATLAALRRGVQEEGSGSSPLCVTAADLAAARAAVRPSAMRDVTLELPPVAWEDVGGQDGVKARLMEALGCGGGGGGGGGRRDGGDGRRRTSLSASPAAMAAVGASAPAGILLFGPPGCSKTLLARAAATAAGRNFFAVKGPELLSPYVGDAEKAVAALFARARASAPSMVFLDELDGLAAARDGGIAAATGSSTAEDGAGAAAGRVVAQLLQEVEAATRASSTSPSAAPPVVILAATNRPDRLDPALLRPGRFDRALHVRPPCDVGEREAVLRAAARKVRLAPGVAEAAFPALAARTAGFTGADLASLVREAALAAVAEGAAGADAVSAAHFEAALGLVRASPAPSAEDAAAYAKHERAGW